MGVEIPLMTATRVAESATTGTPAEGDLARLLETERRLAEVLRRARADGEALVADARARADERAVAAAAELAAALGALDARLAEEARAAVAAVTAEASAHAARFAAISDERVAALATALAARLASGAEDDA